MNNCLADWLEKVIDDEPGIAAIKESEARIVSAYKELLAGYSVDPTTILTVTKETSGHEGLVVQRNIAFCSVCQHHFLPFHGSVSIAYEPGEIIVGLGKLSRLVGAYASRLQIQEELVRQIAAELMSSGRAKGALVYSKATHLCICARGPRSQASETITTYSLGTLSQSERQAHALALMHEDVQQVETNLKIP